MPPKKGKRGRPKKIKTVPEDDDVTEIPSVEEGDESADESVGEVPILNTSTDENQVIDEEVSSEGVKFLEESSASSLQDMGKVQDLVAGSTDLVLGMESSDVISNFANMETMENMDNMESIDSMNNMETIDNMDSMENDEGLDFKGLTDNDMVKTDIDLTRDEFDIGGDSFKVDTGEGDGNAQYDPLLEDMSHSPEQSPTSDNDKNIEQMETQTIEPKDNKKVSEKNKNVALEHETETVSEDELPSETTKPPSDTEAVSDEEFPPNNTSDHLLDTEAVSEDELPPIKKRKADNGSKKKGTDSSPKASDYELTVAKATDQSLDTEAVSDDEELPPVKKKKKQNELDDEKKVDTVEEDSLSKTTHKKTSSSNDDAAGETAKKSSESKSSKSLQELDKYWKAVKDDPSDFTGWTYLLQYVDQGQDVEAAREAYDAFLSHYPYCYGYWRKYADYEKKKGDKDKAQGVFERGLTAIPLSVDLWLHYINHVKAVHKDDENYIRQQYDRSIDICGVEFRSDRLWDSYIKWETENKNIGRVFSIYDKLLTIPTQGYKGHFENFVEFVKANQPNKLLSVDEFLTMRSEVLQKLKQKGSSETTTTANAPPGDESDEEMEKSPTSADEETKLIRDKVITSRTKIFKTMSNAVLERWTFEEGIKRPYFHVKPLERCQLNNWRNYLDFEIEQGDRTRTIVLFERCLIACALYDEFWSKFIKYLESLNESDEIVNKIRNVFKRACTIHHPKKPMLSLSWASFEENQGNVDSARQILIRLENEVPHSLQISICRINLERRSNNYDEVSKLYENYISSNKNKFVTNALSIKYARFCQKVIDDIDKGSEVLKKAIEKDKDNPRLYHQLLDLLFSRNPLMPHHEEECVNIIDQFLERESTDLEHKLLFAQHKVEFLEDFGSNMSKVQKAVSDYSNILKQVKERRRKQFEEKMKTEEKKTPTTSVVTKSENVTTHTPSSSAPNGSSTAASSGYQSNYAAQQQTSYQNNSNQYAQASNYGQPPYGQYNNQQSDPNYNNYQNWNYQQAPAYNNYNQGWGNYNYY